MSKEILEGEIFTLERPSNRGSTGYCWGLAKLENLVLLNTEFVHEGVVLPGVSGKQIWTFQALNAGKGCLQFVKYPPFNPKDACYEEDIPFSVKSGKTSDANGGILGGWSVFREVTSADETLFKTALPDIIGVQYKPRLVSTQTLPKKNFLFVANAKNSVLYPDPYPVLIRVCAKDDKTAEILSIKEIGRPGFVGAFEQFITFDKSGDIAKKLKEACSKRVGLDFTAYMVSQQTVAGRVYLFAGNGKIVYPGAQERPMFLKVYVPPTGDACILEIKNAFEF